MAKRLVTLIEVGCPTKETTKCIVAMPTKLLEEVDDALQQTAQLLEARFHISHTEACQHAQAVLWHMVEHRSKLPVVDEDLGTPS